MLNRIKSIFKNRPESRGITAKQDGVTRPGKSDVADKELSRRDLFRGGFLFFARPAVDSAQQQIAKINASLNEATRRVPLLRPPGAIAESRFAQACTQCDACIQACPRSAIKKAPRKLGLLVMGTPYIEPMQNPCVLCDDLPCIAVCEDGALLPVKNKHDVKMGYAILDKEKCQAYGSSPCRQCITDCPISGAVTQGPAGPVFHENICTGCGICVWACNTVNTPIAVKIKPQMVIESGNREKNVNPRQLQSPDPDPH